MASAKTPAAPAPTANPTAASAPASAPTGSGPVKSGTAGKKAVTAKPAVATSSPGAAPATKAARKSPPKSLPAKAALSGKPAGAPVPSAGKDAERTRKIKLVRDSFAMPKAEYASLAFLKQRAAELARPTKKSELLRAGIKALESMNAAAFLAALNALPAVKTGRPRKV